MSFYDFKLIGDDPDREDEGKSFFIPDEVVIDEVQEESQKGMARIFWTDEDPVLLKYGNGIAIFIKIGSWDEVVKRSAGEKVLMRRIGETIDSSEMAGTYQYPRPVIGNPKDFFHDFGYIVEMLEDVVGDHPVEAVIRKRVGETVEIMDDVRPGTGIEIDTDTVRGFLHTAAEVEDRAKAEGCYFVALPMSA